MTANSLVTFDEFASAIVEACPPQMSMKSFLASITSEGPKEKHSNWIKVCDNIRQAKALTSTSKSWRKNIHKAFITNLGPIEILIWKKMIKQPVNPEDAADVYAALNGLLDNARAELERISAHISN
ncbi:hypothetical protein PV326_008076 [Microctonus aethiopoides]|nr:hypothetical protein PV326_008076 [Microctonus aethiopoides]